MTLLYHLRGWGFVTYSSCEVTLPKKLNNIKWIYGHQLRTYDRGGEIRFYRQVPDTP